MCQYVFIYVGSLVSICGYASMCICVGFTWWGPYMCIVYTRGGQRLAIFLNHSSPYLLRQDLSLSLELDNLLPGQQAPGILLSPQHWNDRHMPPCPAFYTKSGDPNSGSHIARRHCCTDCAISPAFKTRNNSSPMPFKPPLVS